MGNYDRLNGNSFWRTVYYTFEIDGKKVGYYEEKDEDGVLCCNARMEMNGEKFENPFWIKHDNGNISAYKFGDGAYKEYKQKEDVFPSSAISLILAKVKPGKVYTYQIFNEGEGKATGTATLEMTGNKIYWFQLIFPVLLGKQFLTELRISAPHLDPLPPRGEELKRENSTGMGIEEKMNGKLKRYFVMENGKVITYCRGGTALSHKVLNKEEAINGTAWE